jgi:membrane-associated phospholipid phosphatase
MKSSYKVNLLIFIVFILLLIAVIVTGSDKELFLFVNSSDIHYGQFIWANITFLGDTLPVCAIMILFIRKKPDLVWAGILATLTATLMVNLLKHYFDIPRPPAVISPDIIHITGPAIHAHSFPSGHTVTAFTLAGILMFYFRSVIARLLITILAIAIGLSRIAVGVHWPSDVLAGASLGIIFAVTGVYVISRTSWTSNRAAQLIIGFLLILSDIYLLVFYDCKYDQAVYLQFLFSVIILAAGIREYYLLVKNVETINS